MRNSTNLTIWTAALFVANTSLATAETFRCQSAGKTIYSDIPCAANSARVDSSGDKVSRSQKLQAEIVDRQNHDQLSELQYRAARTRQTPASIYILNSANPPPASATTRPARPR